MGIWVNGIENDSSNNATLILKGDTSELDAGKGIPYNAETGGSSSPFEADFPVQGDNRAFRVYDGGNWTLNIEETFSNGHAVLNITRNYGEYKMIITDNGLIIQDVSENEPALQLNGQSFEYYTFFMVNGIMKAEGSVNYNFAVVN